MGSDYPLVPLGELVDEVLDRRGVTPLKLGSDFTSSGHRVISAKVIKSGRVNLEADTARYVDSSTYSKWMRSPLRADDVLLTSEAPLGEAAWLGQDCDWVLGQRLFGIRTDKRKLQGRFLYYSLHHGPVVADLKGRATGTTVLGIRQTQLKLVQVPVPPVHEQRRIAAVLGALDDKIELNRKMNRTLEEMAQALFKSWFVDFDGVPAADLVESELGPIPNGWRWVPFERAGLWVSGGTPNTKREEYWGGDIPWFSAKSLGPLWLQDSDDRVTSLGAANGTRRVPRRSVIFLVRGMSLATEFRIGITARDATLNQDLKAILDDGTVVPELLLLWLLVNREPIRQQADEAGHGTKRLPTTVLQAWSLAMPNREEQERMAAPLCALLSRVEVGQSEIRTLAELRDTLLPKLISGELRVPEAEALVEATL